MADQLVRKLIIQDIDRWKDACSFAEENGFEGPQRELIYLMTGHYAGADLLVVQPDYPGAHDNLPLGQKYSFTWSLHRGEDIIINGGLILHGLGETFSVSLSKDKRPCYQIHT